MQARDPQGLKELLIGFNNKTIDDLHKLSQGFDFFLQQAYSLNESLLLQDVKESTLVGKKTQGVVEDKLIANSLESKLKKLIDINSRITYLKNQAKTLANDIDTNANNAQILEEKLKATINLNDKIATQIATLGLTVGEIYSPTQKKNAQVVLLKNISEKLTSQINDLCQDNQLRRANLSKESGLDVLKTAKNVSPSLDPQLSKKSNYQPK